MRRARGERKRLWPSPDRREDLRARLDRALDLPLAIAAVLMVLVSVLDATDAVHPRWDRLLDAAFYGIWALFLIEFGAKFLLATDRAHYLRKNWLDALVLALPVLRIFKALMALRLGHGYSFVRLLSFGGHGSSAAFRILRRRRMGQVALVTLLVTFLGSAVIYLMERGQPDARIQSFGDALWWTAGTITTSSTELYPVTAGGRVLGVVLMVYAMIFFTYLAASLASVFVGLDAWRRRAAERGDGARDGFS